jgi:hypothetical protein
VNLKCVNHFTFVSNTKTIPLYSPFRYVYARPCLDEGRENNKADLFTFHLPFFTLPRLICLVAGLYLPSLTVNDSFF